MKRAKGCINTECLEYEKKHFKKKENFCNCCGSKLVYVCNEPNCFKQLPEDSKEKYCSVHAAEHKDKMDAFVKKAKTGIGILAIVVAAGASVISNANDYSNND